MARSPGVGFLRASGFLALSRFAMRVPFPVGAERITGPAGAVPQPTRPIGVVNPSSRSAGADQKPGRVIGSMYTPS